MRRSSYGLHTRTGPILANPSLICMFLIHLSRLRLMLDRTNEQGSSWLVFEGLDTFATITFCEQHIASTNNQFRQYAFDISAALGACSGNPVIRIDFASAPQTVDAIAADPSSPKWPTHLINQLPNRWFMRKQQSDFGWDWASLSHPILVTLRADSLFRDLPLSPVAYLSLHTLLPSVTPLQ